MSATVARLVGDAGEIPSESHKKAGTIVLRRAGMAWRWNHVKAPMVLAWTLLTLAVTTYALALARGAQGLRGSDQYWYAADLRMYDSTGRAVSNELYPTYSLGKPAPPVAAYPARIHSGPASYAAQLPHWLGLSDYHSWLAINVLLCAATAALCYATARALGAGRQAVLAAALFLLFPLTLWLSLNALAEMWVAFLTCTAVLGCVVAERKGSLVWALLAGTSAAMLYWTRDNYSLYVLAFCAFSLWLWRLRHWDLWKIAVLIVASAGLVAVGGILFPKYPHGGILSTLMVAAPGAHGNMDLYYKPAAFIISAFALKLGHGLVAALVPSGATELLTETPVIVGTVATLWWLRRSVQAVGLRWWLVTAFATYLATSTFFQSQNRYIFSVVPILCIAVSVAAPSLWSRYPKPVLIGLCVLSLAFAGGSALEARQYRSSALRETAVVTALSRGLMANSSGPLLATGDTATVIPLSYAVLPRQVLVVDSSLNSPSDAAQLLGRWNVRFVVGPASSRPYLEHAIAAARPGAVLRPLEVLPTPGETVTLWTVVAK